jgi:hypothetical protein
MCAVLCGDSAVTSADAIVGSSAAAAVLQLMSLVLAMLATTASITLLLVLCDAPGVHTTNTTITMHVTVNTTNDTYCYHY